MVNIWKLAGLAISIIKLRQKIQIEKVKLKLEVDTLDRQAEEWFKPESTGKPSRDWGKKNKGGK